MSRARVRVAPALLAAPLAGLVLGAAPAGAQAPQARPAETPADAVTVEILDVTPAFLTPGTPLTVRGVVRNGTTTALDAGVVSLRLQSRSPTSRRSLDSWLDPSTTFRTTPLADTETSVPAGQERAVTLTVPAEDLGVGSVPWGPHGVELRVTGADEVAVRDRTVLVWASETSAQPTSLALLVPLAPTAADFREAADGGVPVAVAAQERVRGIVQATAEATTVAWALDPSLLAGAADVTTPGVEDLEGTLRAGSVGRDVVALPYADADVAALTHAEQGGLLTAAEDRGASLRAASGVSTTPGLAWPAGPAVDLATVGALAADGATAVVVPAEQMAPERELTFTPTGRATVPGEEGDVAALLADGPLSAALAGTREDDRALDPAARALDARQYLLASTAMITAERPNDPRAVLAALPRDFHGDAAALADRIATVVSAPWVSPVTLSAFAATPDPEIAREGLPAEAVADGEARRGLLRAVEHERGALLAFAQIVPDPEALVRPQDDLLLQTTSVAWRPEPDARSTFAVGSSRAVSELLGGVGVVDSATVNLISSSGELPVTVRNDLDQAVSVRLRLTSRDPAIQLPDPVPVELGPASEEAVGVPVRAVGSSDVTIVADLLNAEGVRVGTAVSFEVRVRADWENVGTAVVAGVIGVGFVLGLVRNIRRGRRRADLAAAGGDAGGDGTDA